METEMIKKRIAIITERIDDAKERGNDKKVEALTKRKTILESKLK